MKRTAARETYALNKIKKLEDSITEHCCNENQLKIKVLDNLLIEKDKEIRQLKSSNEYLQDLINEKVRTQQEIQLFDEDKNTYKSELKQCVYELPGKCRKSFCCNSICFKASTSNAREIAL